MTSKPTAGGDVLEFKLDAETARGLNKIARLAKKSPRTIVRRAVREYIEDYFDALVLRERLKEPGRRIPLEEVLRRNHLAG